MNPEWKHLNVKALECIIRRLWWYKWDTGDLWQLLMIFCLVMPSVAMGSKYHQPLNNLKETKKEYPYHLQQLAKRNTEFSVLPRRLIEKKQRWVSHQFHSYVDAFSLPSRNAS